MQVDNFPQEETDSLSYGAVLKELGNSTKDLIHDEIALITSEFKQAAHDVTRHSIQAAAFGALLALSVFPFLAFIVIGLGELLDGRYWLSSLIVAVVCALIGGPLAYRAFKKIKEHDLKFSHTKASLAQEKVTVQQNIEKVKEAARGEHYEPNRLH